MRFILVFSLWLVYIFGSHVTLGGGICPTIMKYGCTCEESAEDRAHQITCLKVGFTSIPDDLPHLLQLRIEGNNIAHLSKVPEAYGNVLQKLFLVENNIAYIVDGAFQNLRQLTTLSLARNKLTTLRQQIFTGLNHLKELYLYENPLTSLPDNTFTAKASLPNLQILDLHSCKLRGVGESTFNDLPNVRLVNLSDNHLTSPAHFGGSSQLNEIDLSKNQIEDWYGSSPFTGLHSMEVLNLDENKLQTLHAGMFIHLETLKSLTLRNNLISSVSSDAMAAMKDLHRVDLTGNQIRTLSRSSLPADVDLILLHNNSWECGCVNSWMIKEERVRHSQVPPLTCATPLGVKGMKMEDVSEHLFDCPDPHHGFHSNTVALAVGIVLAAAVAVTGSIILYKLVLKKRLQRAKNGGSAPMMYSRVSDTRGLVLDDDVGA